MSIPLDIFTCPVPSGWYRYSHFLVYTFVSFLHWSSCLVKLEFCLKPNFFLLCAWTYTAEFQRRRTYLCVPVSLEVHATTLTVGPYYCLKIIYCPSVVSSLSQYFFTPGLLISLNTTSFILTLNDDVAFYFEKFVVRGNLHRFLLCLSSGHEN